MKRDLALELIRKIKSKPNLRRKLKIFIIASVVILFTTGALVIWAGISAAKFVATQTSGLISSPQTKEQIENLKTEIKTLPKIKVLTCWDKVQSLMAVEPWIARPAIDNLTDLKLACLEPSTAICNGADCTK